MKNILCRVVTKAGLALYRTPMLLLEDTLFDVIHAGDVFIILDDLFDRGDRIMPVLSPRYGKRWLYIHPATNAVNYYEVV